MYIPITTHIWSLLSICPHAESMYSMIKECAAVATSENCVVTAAGQYACTMSVVISGARILGYRSMNEGFARWDVKNGLLP